MPRRPGQSAGGDRSRSRRQFLAGLGTAATVPLAGCGAIAGDVAYDRSQEDFDPELLPDGEPYPAGEAVSSFRRGLRNLGYYPGVTVPDEVAVAWSEPINAVAHTAAKASPRPTPDGETLLLPADTGRLYAFTPDGDVRWTVDTRATALGIHGTPTIVDGVAYVGGYDGALYAVDVAAGAVRWRLDLGIAIGSSPAYWDGVLYVVVEYADPPAGTMWAIDAETGRPLWQDDRLWGMPHPTTAIDLEHERMVTGSNDGVCYCWEFPSLEFEWAFETGGEIKGPIATYDGAAFVGSWDRHFYRLDLASGEPDWSIETTRRIMSAPAVDPTTDTVYVGGHDWRVRALDVATGDQRWVTNVGGVAMGALTVTDDVVLVGSFDATLYALEKDTGEIRWTVPNRGHVTSAAVPHDGRLYYAERGVFEYGEDEPPELVERGRAYCLEPAG